MSIFVSRRRYWRYGWGGNTVPVSQSESRRETTIQAIDSKLFQLPVAESSVVVAGSGNAPARGAEAPPLGLFGPRTYVAQVERSPEVEYGIEEYREEQGMHLVVGRW